MKGKADCAAFDKWEDLLKGCYILPLTYIITQKVAKAVALLKFFFIFLENPQKRKK